MKDEKRISFRVKLREYEILADAAEKAGLTVTSWVRSQAFIAAQKEEK